MSDAGKADFKRVIEESSGAIKADDCEAMSRLVWEMRDHPYKILMAGSLVVFGNRLLKSEDYRLDGMVASKAGYISIETARHLSKGKRLVCYSEKQKDNLRVGTLINMAENIKKLSPVMQIIFGDFVSKEIGKRHSGSGWRDLKLEAEIAMHGQCSDILGKPVKSKGDSIGYGVAMLRSGNNSKKWAETYVNEILGGACFLSELKPFWREYTLGETIEILAFAKPFANDKQAELCDKLTAQFKKEIISQKNARATALDASARPVGAGSAPAPL